MDVKTQHKNWMSWFKTVFTSMDFTIIGFSAANDFVV